CSKALIARDEVKGENRRSSVERTFRGDVDIAPVELYAAGMGSGGVAGEIEHFGGRIDAVESPTRLSLGEIIELESTPCPQHQDAAACGDALGQELGRHLVKAGEAGNLARWAIGVALGGFSVE